MNAEILIKDIMTSDLLTIQMDDSVAMLKRKFDAYKVHHLLVVNSEDQLVGIVSKGDFYRFLSDLSFQTTGKTWSDKMINNIPSKELMTKEPITLEPDDTIEVATKILVLNRFHAIPIVEGTELVGIVTIFDLLAFGFNSIAENIAGEMSL